ncbi:hypothetical protein [Achromobacter sp. UMC46]|uniref:hypothetical protein n=1 Tax=Achromobacter sp. UMC46 TaxID=1862319 RepID=UPI0016027C48|nr:hypothetical protein [Achromobacter sp. UMC46]MBB1592551.1 hypothetical protein [Achromobacter sp. UMC46]MBB1598379.1 hypothetical protein [Achromobacter sp. UMC46]
MTFVMLHSSLTNLRRRLAVHVSPPLAEITLEPPQGDSDELSFYRLVAWGYVMLNETAKVPLGFLKSLPPWSVASALLPHVGALRTATSHNLALDSTRDIKTLRSAADWFAKTCGAGTPVSPSQWKACFDALLIELSELLTLAIRTCDQLSDPIDGEQLVAQLQFRLDREWPAYKFDPYVERAVEKFGYGLDPVALRSTRLTQWRKVVAAAQQDEIERVLTQRIEADVLEYMCNALPAPTEEIAELLQYTDKAALAAALLTLRAARPDEAKDVLARLRQLSGAIGHANIPSAAACNGS